MSFPRYEKYRDSGIDWLGEVPGHWSALSGKRVFAQIRKPACVDDEQLSATQKYGVVPQRLFMELEDQKVMLALSGLDNFKHVDKDDFVISLRSFQGGIERSLYDGCVSPAYTVLKARSGFSPNYAKYVLKCASYISALQSVTDGIRDGKNISYDQFGMVGLPIPPKGEQRVIATFLDHETAKIDALIAEQERLIELLKEKRQAVISHVVTKGLNPNAPMKPSGIDWLGDVPEHWDVIKSKWIFRLFNGFAFKGDEFDKEAKDFPHLITPGNFNPEGGLYFTDTNSTYFLGSFRDEYALKEDDMVLVMTDLSYKNLILGRVEFVPYDGLLLNQRIAKLLISDEYNAVTNKKYLRHLLNSNNYREQLIAYTTGATVNHTSPTKIEERILLFPSLEEQNEIADFIDKETRNIDSLIKQAHRAISLLQERRTSIISAAVTGKIDVRGLAETQKKEAA